MLPKIKTDSERIFSEEGENLPLFEQSKKPTLIQDSDFKYSELIDLLQSFKPDDLSPKEALNILYEIHDLYKKGQN